MKKYLPIIITTVTLLAGGCSAGTSTPVTDNPPVQQAGIETAEADPENSPETDPVPSSVTPEPEVIETPPEPEPPKTVTILGKEHELTEKYLDLSTMTADDISSVSEALTQMSDLAEINLLNEEGVTELTLPDVAALREAAPDAHFDYVFDLFGKSISTEDTEVTYVKQNIGNDGEEEIRNALSVLDKCEYFLLDDCGIDDEIMDSIRSDFPDTKVVWRIHVGTRSALTDDQVIRMTHGINDTMTGPLKYCHDVVYMDLGHDAGITDISFIEMPLLECIILSDAKMTDITPLANCPNLTWVELVYCDRVKDITPITGLESVKYINISYSGIRDITPLYDMNLDRLCMISIGVSNDTLEEYRESHPDTLAINSGNPYGYAWRYNDYGYHFFWYYARMREAFRYDQGSPGGFKLPDVWINNPPEEVREEPSDEAITEEVTEELSEEESEEESEEGSEDSDNEVSDEDKDK